MTHPKKQQLCNTPEKQIDSSNSNDNNKKIYHRLNIKIPLHKPIVANCAQWNIKYKRYRSSTISSFWIVNDLCAYFEKIVQVNFLFVTSSSSVSQSVRQSGWSYRIVNYRFESIQISLGDSNWYNQYVRVCLCSIFELVKLHWKRN